MSNKRHTKQNHKQKLGQFYTSKAKEIFSGWESLVVGKHVLDPFAGGFDLLNWASDNGARSVVGYDIDSSIDDCITNDSLNNPPDYSGKFLISNPPYLCSNKCREGDKRPYQTWDQNDYYKCHLASLYPSCDEGLMIIPSNFLCESNKKARAMFFANYEIVAAKYWSVPVFEDATTGILAFHFRRGNSLIFPCQLFPENETIMIQLDRNDGYMFGREFFDYINTTPLDIKKAVIGEALPNSKIIVGCLDKGKYKTGFHYNDGESLQVKNSVITTFQVSLPFCLTDDEQKLVIERANERLAYFRRKYYGMFLSNYLGANQKILSVRYANLLLSKAISEVMSNKQSTIDVFFT